MQATTTLLEAWYNAAARTHLSRHCLQGAGAPSKRDSQDICRSLGTGCPGGRQDVCADFISVERDDPLAGHFRG